MRSRLRWSLSRSSLDPVLHPLDEHGLTQDLLGDLGDEREEVSLCALHLEGVEPSALPPQVLAFKDEASKANKAVNPPRENLCGRGRALAFRPAGLPSNGGLFTGDTSDDLIEDHGGVGLDARPDQGIELYVLVP